jgi:hypothetical protein
MSLKRSAALLGQHPKHVNLLETLNIFAVRANYMAQFRDYLEREGVETEPVIELPLFTWINKPALKKELLIPRPPDGRNFLQEEKIALEIDNEIRVRLDMSVHVQMMVSTGQGLHQVKAQAGQERKIPKESLALVDWEQVYLDLLEYKAGRNWHNLIIRAEALPNLLDKIEYTLIADETVARPRTFAERHLLQQAVTGILRKYLDTFYRRRQERWEGRTLEYRQRDENDPNLAFNRQVKQAKPAYIVRVPRSDTGLLQKIEQLIANAKRLYKQEDGDLPRIHFDSHLYLPLLVDGKLNIKSSPPALEESEVHFLRDLKAFWKQEKKSSMAGKEIYVLRNLSRGKGVGFFENSGFYPDFILWVLKRSSASTSQRIIFIEPHGMLHAKAYIHDQKARLHERLPALAQEIARRRPNQGHVELDSYIISQTPYTDLRKRYDDGTWDQQKFAEKHILFPERNENYDYLKIIFAENVSNTSS